MAYSFYPVRFLNAASSPGPGPQYDYRRFIRKVSYQVTFTGNPTEAKYNIEGSFDGTNWIPLVQLDWPGMTGNQPIWQGDLSFGTLTRFLRFNLVALTGGSSPTVTADLWEDSDG
jgi:hypothetical protein